LEVISFHTNAYPVGKLLAISAFQSIALGSGSVFALLGDVSASFIKRKFGVRFSQIIPGMEIFDRFDSLIFSGLFVT
jgi:CDP-diglyceride synthetase